MSLSHVHSQSLHEGMHLLEVAPPRVRAEISRIERLHLQRALLETLPGWRAPMPFTIWWRHFFCWSDRAVIGCGVVAWDGRQAAFAVDGECSSLWIGPQAPSSILLAAWHLGRRPDSASA